MSTKRTKFFFDSFYFHCFPNLSTGLLSSFNERMNKFTHPYFHIFNDRNHANKLHYVYGKRIQHKDNDGIWISVLWKPFKPTPDIGDIFFIIHLGKYMHWQQTSVRDLLSLIIGGKRYPDFVQTIKPTGIDLSFDTDQVSPSDVLIHAKRKRSSSIRGDLYQTIYSGNQQTTHIAYYDNGFKDKSPDYPFRLESRIRKLRGFSLTDIPNIKNPLLEDLILVRRKDLIENDVFSPEFKEQAIKSGLSIALSDTRRSSNSKRDYYLRELERMNIFIPIDSEQIKEETAKAFEKNVLPLFDL